MRVSYLACLVAAAAGTAGCKEGPPSKHGASIVVTGSAAPDDAPNAPAQKPAFAEQTRAKAPASPSRVRVETITSDLDTPWAVEVLRDGRFVVTEKSGALRVVTRDGRVLPAIGGIPEVDDSGQGGLLDVAVAEGADELTLCITYSEPRADDKNGTTAACATATGEENLTLGPLQILFRQEPAWDSTKHFGSRFVFASDDIVYITTGERSEVESRVLSQDTDTGLGKVIRLKRDGSVPDDNPFAAQGGNAAQVWSYGHRNIQSAALDSDGRLWTVEHGAQGGDELNRPEAGKNYGWPVITYGEDYSGSPIGTGITEKEGMEQPLYYWDPVIAPSGMVVYSGKLFEAWRGDVLIGGLVAQGLVRLTMDGDRVTSEERIELNARVRDVSEGPDGAIYLVTDEGAGKLLKVTPAE
jgi:aldose sugar dehydrogenase